MMVFGIVKELLYCGFCLCRFVCILGCGYGVGVVVLWVVVIVILNLFF